jgi:antirestriction protein
MFQYKSATGMIIHVFGNIEDQFIKNHQYLLSLADFLIEIFGSHGSVRYDMGLGHFSQVDTVKDFDDNNNGEEYNDVDYSQRRTARILFIVSENTR